ncbi:MAG: peptidoglycan DD-metalloendopeptidase family protein [Pseudoxanthomonas sp.]
MQSQGEGGRRRRRFRERLEILRDSTLHRHVRKHLPSGRWTRRQWIHASLFMTIGIMVATIVPGFSSVTQPEPPALATLPLALPRAADAPAATAVDEWQMVRIQPGQTLSALFDEYGIPAATLQQLLDAKEDGKALHRLHPGDEIALELGQDGQLHGLRYDRDPDTRVELQLGEGGVERRILPRDVVTRTVVLSGTVGDSLNRSARKAGLTAANINAMADDIFKYDIDFNTDLDPDDRFSVVVEQTWRDGELVSTGPLQAATITMDGKLYSGFRFTPPGGRPEYFTFDGRPLKKAFIRMPIPYARLSSSFGARKHPILGTMRMHKGVDYAAAMGTPIMAAGDARVQFVGKQNGYGNVVILDHGQGRSTLYGHMSRFAGIRVGQRIAQGTVIGYVGMTGMATGPHLHYEFRVNGAQRNPLSITLPPPQPLSGSALAAFRGQTSSALARIATVEKAIYADWKPAVPATSKVAMADATLAPSAQPSGKATRSKAKARSGYTAAFRAKFKSGKKTTPRRQ